MTQICNSIKALITSEMINKASTLLEEKHSDVSNAVATIIPSFLGILLKKGHSPQIKNILEEAGNLNIENHAKHIFEEKPTENQQNIGDDFLQHLLGDKAADFTNPIATHSGMSKVATNRLISMVAPIVAGYLGNKIIKEKLTMAQLVDEIDKEKAGFEGAIPTDLIKSFDLYSKLQLHNVDSGNSKAKTASANNGAKTTSTHKGSENKPEKAKKRNEWIMWVILLLIILALFLWWKSCRGEKKVAYTEQETVIVLEPEKKTASTKTMKELTLPNGVKLNAYAGGVEDKMIKFLESDEYKKATNETLKNKWFEFDNIDFEFGSSTELQSGSKTQLNNIIEILKYYKNAKIKIGAFADVIGSEKSNMKISEDRAKTIEMMLEKGGVGSQVAKVQGYGEEYAIHSANESNEARAEDRDIALRFVK